MGFGRFVFNIVYVCYRFGLRQVCVKYMVCVLQVWKSAGLCLIKLCLLQAWGFPGLCLI